MKPPRLQTIRSRLEVVDLRIARVPPKAADPHYATPEHQAWRAAVIKRSGGMCQGAGCKDPQRGRGRMLFADHIAELRDGGAPLDLANGQALCGSCHSAKTIAERGRRNGWSG